MERHFIDRRGMQLRLGACQPIENVESTRARTVGQRRTGDLPAKLGVVMMRVFRVVLVNLLGLVAVLVDGDMARGRTGAQLDRDDRARGVGIELRFGATRVGVLLARKARLLVILVLAASPLEEVASGIDLDVDGGDT